MISIIIATYNAASTLGKALHSVQTQHFQDWECLVVDGASTDDTLCIVAEYEARDSRFRHISEPDRGTYDAFNKGWRMAKGEWIYYLGADDELLPKGLEDLITYARTEADVISGTIEVRKTDGTIVTLPSGSWEGCHQAKLTRRTALEAMHGFDGNSYPISADLDCYVRMRMANMRIIDAITKPISRFSMGGQSQKFSSLPRIRKEYLCIFGKDPHTQHAVLKTHKLIAHMFLSIVYRKIRTLLR